MALTITQRRAAARKAAITIEKEKETEKPNLYFLFIGMIYLELNSDSKFLHEYAYVWAKARLES